MTTVQFCEINPFCRRVLRKNWPDIPVHDDIKTLQPLEADLVCGGFPCQPFSVAGKQKGHQDDRHLWPEMLRVISQVRPTWVISENVAGLITLGLDKVLLDLENEGYTTRTFVIPACAVGAEHRRDRVWIVAHSDEKSKPTVAFDGEKRSGELVTEESLAYPNSTGCIEQWRSCTAHEKYQAFERGGWWEIEPGVGRVADGVSDRVDRLRALGNAVVPQVVYEIGRAIVRVN